MESGSFGLIVSSVVVAWVVVKLVNMVWFHPRKLEKLLREQGLGGNPYRLFLGDMKEYFKAIREEQHRSIQMSDDVMPHVLPYQHRIISTYGPCCFYWFGSWPRVMVSDPEIMKEILRRTEAFEKPFPEVGKLLTGGGLVFLEGQQWAKRRKILNHAFHLHNLKDMVPAMVLSCSNTILKLKAVAAGEVDIWPYLEDLAGDVISRAAFGSSYEQGTRVFQLQKQRVDLSLKLLQYSFVPGWRYLPTKLNRQVKAVTTQTKRVLRDMIEKREKAMETGEDFPNNDLLTILMEANRRSIEGGMSIEDVIEECQLFYFAGSETVAGLLVWTILMLCSHPEWQTQARQEVDQVFGQSEPTPQGLNRLKIVTMILQETLRMYPVVPAMIRSPKEAVKIGGLTIPAGVHLELLISLAHYDAKIWGDDAKEFKPERFAGGVSKTQATFMPFSSGPRICIGHNLAITEAKLAIAMLLQHFSFHLSPSYTHAPFSIISLKPHYGAPIILHRLHQ